MKIDKAKIEWLRAVWNTDNGNTVPKEEAVALLDAIEERDAKLERVQEKCNKWVPLARYGGEIPTSEIFHYDGPSADHGKAQAAEEMLGILNDESGE